MGIKQLKTHLKRDIGEWILTYDEFPIVIAQTESCLNSRPFVAVSTDPNNFTDLKPEYCILEAALNNKYETSNMEDNQV